MIYVFLRVKRFFVNSNIGQLHPMDVRIHYRLTTESLLLSRQYRMDTRSAAKHA